MRFKFVFSAEWPSLPQCLALCLNIIIHNSMLYPNGMGEADWGLFNKSTEINRGVNDFQVQQLLMNI